MVLTAYWPQQYGRLTVFPGVTRSACVQSTVRQTSGSGPLSVSERRRLPRGGTSSPYVASRWFDMN